MTSTTHIQPTQPAALPYAPLPQAARPDVTGRTYEHVLAGYPGARWRSLVAVILVIVGYGIIAVVTSVAGFLLGGFGADGSVRPLGLALLGVGLAALTPLSFLAQRLMFPGAVSLSSVAGRFRWSLLAACAVVVLPVTVGYMSLFTWFTRPDGAARSADWLGFLLVGLLVIPFQAAGEEFGFRGLLTRAAAAWSLNPAVALVAGTVVSATAFVSAHLAADPWLIAYYVVVALSLTVATRLTGGLEAAVLLHVANNVVAIVVGALILDPSRSFERGVGTGGPFMLVQMGFFVVMSGVMVMVARRRAAQHLV